jgi:hypothetical protein
MLLTALSLGAFRPTWASAALIVGIGLLGSTSTAVACTYKAESRERYEERILNLALYSKAIARGRIVDEQPVLSNETKNKYVPIYQVKVEIREWYTPSYPIGNVTYAYLTGEACGKGHIPRGLDLLLRMDESRIVGWWRPEDEDAIAIIQMLSRIKRSR